MKKEEEIRQKKEERRKKEEEEEHEEQSQTTVNQPRLFTFSHTVRSEPVALVLFETSDLSAGGFKL